jgi:acetyltransferase-like isoleucine patch superfamily enzyme
MVVTSTHSLSDFKRVIAKPVILEKNVWITANVTILGGVTIGHNSVIGAGSVVTKSIPPGVLAAGNPCRPIRDL